MKIALLLLLFYSLYAQESLLSKYERGESIYIKTCVACHGKNGTPNKDFKLIVRPRSLNKTILLPEQLYRVIKDGARAYGAHSDIMPAFKYVLQEKDLRAVSYYVSKRFAQDSHKNIKELLKEPYTSINQDNDSSRLTGEKIFKKRCANCHGVSGDAKSPYVKGSIIDENFIYPYNLQKLLLNEKQIFLFTKYGSHYWGSYKEDMPAWGAIYTDEELKSVAQYVNEFIKKK